MRRFISALMILILLVSTTSPMVFIQAAELQLNQQIIMDDEKLDENHTGTFEVPYNTQVYYDIDSDVNNYEFVLNGDVMDVSDADGYFYTTQSINEITVSPLEGEEESEFTFTTYVEELDYSINITDITDDSFVISVDEITNEDYTNINFSFDYSNNFEFPSDSFSYDELLAGITVNYSQTEGSYIYDQITYDYNENYYGVSQEKGNVDISDVTGQEEQTSSERILGESTRDHNDDYGEWGPRGEPGIFLDSKGNIIFPLTENEPGSDATEFESKKITVSLGDDDFDEYFDLFGFACYYDKSNSNDTLISDSDCSDEYTTNSEARLTAYEKQQSGSLNSIYTIDTTKDFSVETNMELTNTDSTQLFGAGVSLNLFDDAIDTQGDYLPQNAGSGRIANSLSLIYNPGVTHNGYYVHRNDKFGERTYHYEAPGKPVTSTLAKNDPYKIPAATQKKADVEFEAEYDAEDNSMSYDTEVPFENWNPTIDKALIYPNSPQRLSVAGVTGFEYSAELDDRIQETRLTDFTFTGYVYTEEYISDSSDEDGNDIISPSETFQYDMKWINKGNDLLPSEFNVESDSIMDWDTTVEAGKGSVLEQTYSYTLPTLDEMLNTTDYIDTEDFTNGSVSKDSFKYYNYVPNGSLIYDFETDVPGGDFSQLVPEGVGTYKCYYAYCNMYDSVYMDYEIENPTFFVPDEHNVVFTADTDTITVEKGDKLSDVSLVDAYGIEITDPFYSAMLLDTPVTTEQHVNSTNFTTSDDSGNSFSDIDTSISGEHKFTAKYTNIFGETFEKELTLIVNDSYVNASNFKVHVDDAAILDEDEAIYLAEAETSNGNLSANSSELDDIVQAGINNEVASFPLTFTSTNGESKTVQVLVYNDDTHFGAEIISANGFVLTTTDAQSITEAQINEKSNVVAFDLDYNKIGYNLLDSDTLISKLQASNGGSYNAVYETETGNTDKSINIIVVPDDGSIDYDSVVFADNFTVHVNDNVSNSVAVDKANAVAYDLTDYTKLAVVADKDQLETINDSGSGVYPLTFTTNTSNPGSITVYVTVKDDDTVITTDELVDANSFIVKSSQLPIDEDDVDNYSNVIAQNRNDGSALDVYLIGDSVKMLDEINAADEGMFPLTYTTDNGTTKQIWVTVDPDDGSVIGTSAIYADDFTIEVDELTLNDATAIEKANVEAYYTNGHTEIKDILVDQDELGEITGVGVYPLTFTTDNDDKASTTIIVTVKDGDTTIDPSPEVKEFIYAADFTISPSDAATLDESDIEDLSGVMAYSLTDASPLSFGLSADSQAKINTINSSTEGIFEMKYEVSNSNATPATSQTFFITIDPGDGSVEGDTVLLAYNFKVHENTIMSESDAISNANAVAYDTQDGSKKHVDVNASQLAYINGSGVGVYPLKFTSDDNTVKTIYVTVYNDDTVLSDSELLHAENFKISVSDARTLTESTGENSVDALSNLVSQNRFTGEYMKAELTDASKDVVTQINNSDQGVFALTYYIVDSIETPKTSKTIFVTIDPGDGSVDGETVVIASDFQIKYDEDLNKNSAIFRANAYYANTENGNTSTDLIVDTTQLATINDSLGGSYPLTFTANNADAPSKNIIVTVIGEDSVIENDVVLTANSFTVTVEEASKLTYDDVNDKSNVTAFDKNTAAELTPELDANSLAMISDVINYATDGTYPVTYFVSASDGSVLVSKTIYITVNPEDGSVNKKIAITGDNFITTVDPQLDNEDVVNQSSAIVTYVKNGIYVPSATSPFDPANPVIVSNDSQLAGINSSSAGVYELNIASNIENTTDVDKDIYVGLTDDNTVVEGEKLLDADNFIVTVDEAKDITIDNIDDYTDVVAQSTLDAEHLDYTLDNPDVVDTINASLGGVYSVTYTINESTTSITVQAAVIPDDDHGNFDEETMILANGFEIAEDATDMSASDAIGKADAVAYDVNSGDKVGVIVDSTQLDYINTATPGVYPLTFTSDNSNAVEYTVYVIVYNDETVIDYNTDEMISANDFTITSYDQPLTEDDVDVLSGVVAYTIEDGTKLDPYLTDESLATLADINVAEDDVFPLTYSTPSGDTTKTIWVTIDPGDGSVGNLTSVVADDFSIKTTDAAVLTENNAKAYADARATNMDDGKSISVSADSTQLQYIVEMGEEDYPGVYPLTFTSDNSDKISKTIYVTVYNDNTVIDDKYELISANDIIIDVNTASTLDEAKLVDLTHANAQNTDTGAYLDFDLDEASKVELAEINNSDNGVFEMTYYIVDSANDPATSVTFYVTINPNDGSSVVGSTSITAENFEIHADDADMDENDAIKNANAVAVDTSKFSRILRVIGISNVDVTVDSEQLNTINVADDGVYPLTFTGHGENETVTTTVYVTVINGESEVNYSDEEILTAYSFTIKHDDENLTVDSVDTLSRVNAQYMSDGTVIDTYLDDDSVDMLDTINAAEEGIYPLTYHTVTDKTSKTIYVTVDPGDGSVSQDSIILADNFRVYENEDDMNDDDAIKNANAEAFNKENKEPVDIEVNDSELEFINDATPGVYPLTFTTSTDNPASKTVYVSVIGDETVYNEEELVDAHSFIITDADKPLDEDAVDVFSKVVAYNRVSGAEIDVYLIDESVEMLSEINAADEGMFPLTYTTDEGTTKQIWVTVNPEDGSVEGESVIYAENFTIDVEELTLDDETAIAKAQVEAYNTNDHSLIKDILVDQKELGEITEVGVYPLTFTTDNDDGAATTIYVTVKGDETVIDVEEFINANDIRVTEDEASTLTDTDVERLSEVKAYNKETGEELGYVLTDSSYDTLAQINGSKDGVFALTYVIVDSQNYPATSKTIYLTIDPEDGSVDGDTAITAHGFKITLEETLTNDSAIYNADAIATDTDDGTGIGVLVDDTQLAKINAGGVGVYNLTFTSDNHDAVSTTVKVIKYSGDTSFDIDEMITASNVVIKSSEAKVFDEDKLDKLSNAIAHDTISGNLLDFELDANSKGIIKDKINVSDRGVFALTYIVNNSVNDPATSRTIYVTINPEDGSVSDGAAIFGDSFTMKTEDASVTTAEDVIEAANAYAINTTNGSLVDVTVDADELANIQAMGEAGLGGVYPITFYDAMESEDDRTPAQTTVQAILVNDDTVVEEDNEELIYATDIVMSASEVGDITEDDIDTLSNLNAQNITTGEDVEAYLTDSSLLVLDVINSSDEGLFILTYTTDLGTTKDIYFVINPEDGSVASTTLIMSDDFTLYTSEAQDMTEEEIIDLSNVFTFDTGAESSVEFELVSGYDEMITAAENDEEGDYEIVYRTSNENQAETTTIVTLISDNEEDSDTEISETGFRTNIFVILLLSVLTMVLIIKKKHIK